MAGLATRHATRRRFASHTAPLRRGRSAAPPFEHFYLSLQAAGAGLGAAIGSVYMVGDELSAGRLTAPHGFVRDGSAYVALAREPFDRHPAREALLNWLRISLAASARPWIGTHAPQ
ncbi:hypothetical protein [Pandoraea nosoerga]|uniref:hypothetical protein n=1 Tax=Pandoraea nosoerga TaxID=2508296 RepID=UPI001F1209D7|nr:hypothetical protein [Pandoraea nosoerga]